MNISNQTRDLICGIGETVSTLYTMRMTPLQILILFETRYCEGKLAKGEHLFASVVRKNIEKLQQLRGDSNSPPSRQAFWDSFNSLKDGGFVYIAPHKKGTTKRAIAMTAKGEDLFKYPESIHPYRTEPTTSK